MSYTKQQDSRIDSQGSLLRCECQHTIVSVRIRTCTCRSLTYIFVTLLRKEVLTKTFCKVYILDMFLSGTCKGQLLSLSNIDKRLTYFINKTFV